MSKRLRGLGWVRRAVHWLFGAPFEELPPEFGDTVPPELRVFEKKADEMEHHPIGEVSAPPRNGHRRSKPKRKHR
jgi:hypothetical protein